MTERPSPEDEQATDVLADVLNTLHLSTLVYGRFELSAPWGIQASDREAAHIFVVARGGALLEVEGAPAPVSLSAGDLALLPHGGIKALRDAPGSPLHRLDDGQCPLARLAEPIRLGGGGARTTLVSGAFQFGAASRTLLFERLPRVIHITAEQVAASPSLAATVQLFIAESASRSPGVTVVVSRLADILLVQALRTYIASTDCRENGLRALADPHIGKALSLIHDRPTESWTVEGLAATVGLSRSGFAARFSALVGEPPLEYLARWRMTKAAEFLRDSDLSLSQVAGHVGYQSEASFNRAFKRWEGVAPGAYRRQRRSA
ncbi:AraC family transcriptional regulator [Hyalangium rubrum]|uniref:AraC family transcriptional regulator n=1 Tax=Hyalangium rubrum TaxID=3103134 RepID=A0ABU5GVZ6_9BACT|nr:AraC family transcriptional regulator [Hyalangium sp. s54d21]MDY7225350.1 AraC family transcriptional regulator [Hyalangium sp. s54d21]